MLVQQDKVRSTKFQLFNTVTFVLAGRTTLSEHLPGDKIEVAICSINRSPYLRVLVEQQSPLHQALPTIELRGFDPAGFKFYVEWLATSKITYPTQLYSSTSSGLLLCDCIDLIYAHITGSQLEEPEFQDYVIDEISRRLDPAQSTDLRVFEAIFVEEGASSVLKRFVVDKMFALEKKMLGMLRGSTKHVASGGDNTGGCEYHVHGVGKCYRNVPERQIPPQGKAVQELYHTVCKEESPIDVYYQGKMCDETLIGETAPRKDCKKICAPAVQYSGSAAWSQDVYGVRSRASAGASNSKIDKLLPGLPIAAQSDSSQLYPFVQLHDNHHVTQCDLSTPSFVTECLQRRALKGTSVSTRDLECLRRLPSSSTSAKVGGDNAVSVTEVNRISSETIFQEKSHVSPTLSLRTSLSVRLPPVSRIDSSVSRPGNCAEHGPEFFLSLQPPSPLPRITRKPAPARGLDWIEQWDRLDAMKGRQGFELRREAKVKKSSRFKKILGPRGKRFGLGVE